MKIVKKIFDFSKKFSAIILFLAIIVAAFVFRSSVARRDTAKLEQAIGARFAPYLVESAVMYSYINKVADGESIAEVDRSLPAMQNFKAAEQMSFSLEYAGGWLLRLYRYIYGKTPPGAYEQSYEESRFLRNAFAWYIALLPAFIFLALRLAKVPVCIALAAALLEVFSAAALGRYTGQDLIKGAFALPIFGAYLAASSGALYGSQKIRRFALIAAALTAAAAVASWDASQMLLGLLALSEMIRAVITNRSSRKRRDLWLMTFLAVTLTALCVPYNRAHGTFFSPVLLGLIPGAILMNIKYSRANRLCKIGLLILLAITAFAGGKLSPFAGNYGHFAELVSAKIRFFNRLPADPGLLTFNQRYLWTPELHSASWKITRMIFPALLYLLPAAWLGYIVQSIYLKKQRRFTLIRRVRSWEITQWVLLTVIAAVMYAYFMRFRDITVIFAVMATAFLFTSLYRQSSSRVWHAILLVILLGAVAVEWRQSRRLQRGYPQGLHYTAEMLRYLRQYDLAGKVFLSDMQTSTMLKGYTNASILVQAKYELPEVRKITEEFILTFFNRPIAEFADFCYRNKVDYVLVHLPTVTTPLREPYSYRYISNRPKLRRTAAAGILASGAPAENFFEIALPAKITNINGYRLYRFVSSKDLKQAAELTDLALEEYYLGKRKRARKLIRQAVKLAPGLNSSYKAYVLICRRLPDADDLPKRKVQR